MEDMGVKARLTRYGMVGIITNLSGYGVFLALLHAGMPPILTTGITYVIIVAASYYANRRWSFRSTTTHSMDVPRYLLAYGIGLAVAVAAMYVLSAILLPAFAQLIVILLSAISIYSSLEMLRFGRPGTFDDR